MKLNNLVPLYRNMVEQKLDRVKFPYRHNNLHFDVFFFIDGKPFELLFGALGANLCFRLRVEKGFVINPSLDSDTYKSLCKALNLKYDPANPFKISKFFMDFDDKIPPSVTINNKAKYTDIAVHVRDVEEADKIYFCGWKNNNEEKSHVTEDNLRKTKEFLGCQAYLICKEKNISSRWTDLEHKAKDFYLP